MHISFYSKYIYLCVFTSLHHALSIFLKYISEHVIRNDDEIPQHFLLSFFHFLKILPQIAIAIPDYPYFLEELVI